MPQVRLAHEADFAGWREAARRLLMAEVLPDTVAWRVGDAGDDLFAAGATVPKLRGGRYAVGVPRAFIELAELVVQHRDAERFQLLYRLLWRFGRGERHLLERTADPEVVKARRLAQAVGRDRHKMRAFVRFREIEGEDGPQFLSWFEPEHYTLEGNVLFFTDRFAQMRWSILTPYRSAHWDGREIAFAAGASRADMPGDDALEAYWRTYYASIFNPARLKTAAMRAEMPKKYWANLPEAALIGPLTRAAAQRSDAMVEAEPTAPAVRGRVLLPAPAAAPAAEGLDGLAQEAASCRNCPLWAPATRTVFGEGLADARIMLVGEQPGDQEDLAGRPFVGPAGQLLDRALAAAGLDRAELYVTNAVKHFKFTPRGKRRIHQSPSPAEIAACLPWLRRETALVRPDLLVLLGGSAGRAVLGRPVRVGEERGRIQEQDGMRLLLTVHPSYLLRLPDEAAKRAEYERFVADLRLARSTMTAATARTGSSAATVPSPATCT